MKVSNKTQRDKQLHGVTQIAVLQKRRLFHALNAKEFARLAGICRSTARAVYGLEQLHSTTIRPYSLITLMSSPCRAVKLWATMINVSMIHTKNAHGMVCKSSKCNRLQNFFRSKAVIGIGHIDYFGRMFDKL